MTYLQFHCVFTIPVVVVLALVQARPVAGVGAGEAFRWLGGIIALALVWTTPWDNYLVYRGVWTYPADRVLFTIGYVPVEEYLFMILQSVMAGLLYFALRGRGALASPTRSEPRWFRPTWVGFYIAITALGVLALVHPDDCYLYFGLLLAWAAPVLAGMGAVGSHKIWAERRRVSAATAALSAYLWACDRFAIAKYGIWDIVDRYTVEVEPLGLPVEEATFFVLTTALCVVGLALFLPPTAGRSRDA